MCIGSPLSVREPTSFQQRRNQDGYQQQTREHAAMWQHQSDDLAKCQREGPFFSTTFSRPFKDHTGTWRNASSFGLHDLEALMNVAFEAKEWISAHVLKR
jgi:hypothetical protein